MDRAHGQQEQRAEHLPDDDRAQRAVAGAASRDRNAGADSLRLHCHVSTTFLILIRLPFDGADPRDGAAARTVVPSRRSREPRERTTRLERSTPRTDSIWLGLTVNRRGTSSSRIAATGRFLLQSAGICRYPPATMRRRRRVELPGSVEPRRRTLRWVPGRVADSSRPPRLRGRPGARRPGPPAVRAPRPGVDVCRRDTDQVLGRLLGVDRHEDDAPWWLWARPTQVGERVWLARAADGVRGVATPESSTSTGSGRIAQVSAGTLTGSRARRCSSAARTAAKVSRRALGQPRAPTRTGAFPPMRRCTRQDTRLIPSPGV